MKAELGRLRHLTQPGLRLSVCLSEFQKRKINECVSFLGHINILAVLISVFNLCKIEYHIVSERFKEHLEVGTPSGPEALDTFTICVP